MPRSTTCFLIGLLFVTASGVAQDQRVVDSLEAELRHREGKESLPYLVDLAAVFVDNDNERALRLMEEAEAMSRHFGDSTWIVTCMRIRGQILYRLQRSDEAITIFEDIPRVVKGNDFDGERLKTLIPYGVIRMYRSEFDRALQLYAEARELAIARQDTARLNSILTNFGIVCYKLEDYSKAIHYWKNATQLVEPTNGGFIGDYVNLSLAYAHLGDLDEARKALDQGTSRCRQYCSDQTLIHIHFASGVIYDRGRDYEKALLHFSKSYNLAKGTGDIRMQLDNIEYLTDILVKENQSATGLSYLREAENVIDAGSRYNREVIAIYERFAEIYLDRQDFQKAALYQSKYIALKDSIHSEELTRNLMKAEADYLERHNRVKIASQQQMISLKEEVIGRQKALNLVLTLLALAIFGGCIVLYRNYRLKRAMNFSLEARVRERTHELESSRNELMLSLKERDVLLSRAKKEILEAMTTIKGLCHTGKEELNRFDVYSYLERIEKTSARLSGHMTFLFAGARPD